MAFPVFFILLAAFLILAAAALLPFRRPRASAARFPFALTAAALLAGACAGCFAGYKLGYDALEAGTAGLSADGLEAFYAEVQEVDGHTLTVKGFRYNEARYRGETRYEIWGETTILREDEPIALSELTPGDLVCVILLSGEGTPLDVFKIQLLPR